MKKINAIKQYKLKDGQSRYRFTIRVDNSHVTSRNGFFDYSSAELAYYNLKQEILQHKYRVAKKIITFRELYDKWLKQYKNTVRSTTFYTAHRRFDNHILPFFGEKYIDKITVEDCQMAVNKWVEELATFQPMIWLSNAIFNEAVKYDYITINPMSKVDIPRNTQKMEELKRTRKQKNFYSLDEMDKFLKAARKKSLIQFAFFRTLAYTGCRLGECVALTWDDINFETNYICVNKTMVYNNDKHIFEIHATKTDEIRNLIMDQETMDILSAWKSVQDLHEYKNNYAFTSQFGIHLSFGTPKHWQKVLNKEIHLDHDVSIHGFRHTHATLLYSMNPDITPKDVQKRLGHSKIDVTMNIYEHVTDDSDQKILDALSDMKKK